MKILGGQWSKGDFLAALGLAVAACGVIVATLAVPGMPKIFHWDSPTPDPPISQESVAESLTVRCEPACTTDTNFALSVSRVDGTKSSGRTTGVAKLGILLPEPTALRSWSLSANGKQAIPSGLGVPNFASGDVFSLIRVESVHPIDFNSFRRLSGDAGVGLSSYNVFVFSLGSFVTAGQPIEPIVFSEFNGAQNFPAGTIFFAFMLDDDQNGHVVNQSSVTRLEVVTRSQ
jgi:hypothetical protein